MEKHKVHILILPDLPFYSCALFFASSSSFYVVTQSFAQPEPWHALMLPGDKRETFLFLVEYIFRTFGSSSPSPHDVLSLFRRPFYCPSLISALACPSFLRPARLLLLSLPFLCFFMSAWSSFSSLPLLMSVVVVVLQSLLLRLMHESRPSLDGS